MAFVDIDQGSVDWLHMRVGCVSASRMSDVMAVRKRGEGELAARLNYKKQKVFEIISGLTAETYVTPAMEFGMETEPFARGAYELYADTEVQPGGLFIHDRISRFVASPDGRIGTDGLLEIKCLTSTAHIDVLLAGEAPEEYRLQMAAQLACSGRQWCDFVSFDPRLPKKHRLFVRRFNRDEKRIAEMEKAVEQFLVEVDELLERLSQDDPASLVPALVKSLGEPLGS